MSNNNPSMTTGYAYTLTALSQSGDKARYNSADGSKYGGAYGEVYLSVAELVAMYGGIPTAIVLPVPSLGVGASVVDADGLRVAFGAHVANLTEQVAAGNVRQREVMRLAGERALASMLAGTAKPAKVKAAPKPAKAAPAPKPAAVVPTPVPAAVVPTPVPAARGGRRPVAMAADATPVPAAPKATAMADAGTEARFAALESGLSLLTGQLTTLVNALTPAAGAPAGRITGRKGR